MTLIVLFIALIIERFFDFSHLRYWSWYSYYAMLFVRKSKAKSKSPYVTILILTLPLLFLLLIVNLLLTDVLYGFVTLILHILILLYCFGPQNLWADAYTSLNALAHDEPNIAADKLKLTFNINERRSEAQTLHKVLLEQFFIACNLRIFAAVVFYVVFGIAGVLLYRLVAILAQDSAPIVRDLKPDVILNAQTILDVLDWVPVRVLTFLFALGGNFMQVFSSWMKFVLDGISFNKKLLIECGFKALGDEVNNKIVEDGSAEKSAINLFDRVMIITLVIIALSLLSY